MMNDIVMHEIAKFFLANGFDETKINDEIVYKNKKGYYLLSRGVQSGYYLEFARTLEEAEKSMYEDIASFNIAFNSPEIIDEIKGEITEYVLKKQVQSNKKVDILEVKPMKPGEVFIHCAFKDASIPSVTDELNRFRLENGHEFPVVWTMLSDSLKDRIFAVIVSNDFPLAPYPNTGIFV